MKERKGKRQTGLIKLFVEPIQIFQGGDYSQSGGGKSFKGRLGNYG